MATGAPNEFAARAAELRACATRHHAQIAAALAAGEVVPFARERFQDDGPLRDVGPASATAEPPLLPGAHKAR
ncbi:MULTISPECIES: hypothetical protein [Nannocystis]|uniref:Uncharacterized protein n=1 Tax=Nannocystis radixulma TaxID=2995305 RepID=A0ABT5BDW4_9BACT|nr:MULTISPECIES: hypothetical protein [Nannocystis]MCY1059376.1 hypothetical protein [Nannocystis sp. SCPEA4]MDC0672349.1 hypothetical protein [Nannocystis radixulma]